MLERLRDWAFGYDIFISYDHDEAGEYATALKESLESQDRPLRCCLDRVDFDLGRELDATARRRLHMARYIVVLLTEGVGKPDSWVPRELDFFTDGGQRRSDRIIPLNIARSAEAMSPDAAIRKFIPLAQGPGGGNSVIYHPVPAEEFAAGPSAFTIKRIQSLITTRHVDQTRLRFFQAASAVMFLLLLVALGMAWFANNQQQLAEKNEKQAKANEEQALTERNRALENQSRLLEKEGRIKLSQGDNVGAMLLALEALPDVKSPDKAQAGRPYVPSVENLLSSAQYSNTEIAAYSLFDRTFALSPNGQRVAIASGEGDVELLDILTNTRRQLPRHHTRAVEGIVFSADGRFFATLAPGSLTRRRPGEITVWDESGAFVQKAGLAPEWDNVQSMALGPGASRLVLGLQVNAILIKLDEQASTISFGEGRHLDGIHKIFFSDDGSKFVTVSNADRMPRVWTSLSAELLGEMENPNRVNAVEFSVDGTLIATATDVGIVKIWDVTKATFIMTRTVTKYGSVHLGRLCCLRRLKDQDVFVGGTDEGVLFRFAIDRSPDGYIEFERVHAHGQQITDLLVGSSPDEMLFASADGSVVRLSPQAVNRVGRCGQGSARAAKPIGSSGNVAVICESQAAGLSANTLQVFGQKQPIDVVRYGPTLPRSLRINRVKFDSSGTRLLFAGEGRNAGLLDLSQGARPILLRHGLAVWDANFSADGKYVITASGDGGSRVWSTGSDAPLATFGEVSGRQNGAIPEAVVLSPDGKYAIAALSDGMIRIWDVNTKKEQEVRPPSFGDNSGPIRLALNKAGNRLVVAIQSLRGRWYTDVVVYELDGFGTLKQLPHEMRMNGRPVNLRFTHDDRSLVVMSEHEVVWASFNDREQRFDPPWSVEIETREGGDAVVTPNGQRLIVATCQRDDWNSLCLHARIIDTKSKEEIGRLTGHGLYITSIDVSADGNQIATASADGTIRTWKFHQTTQGFVEQIQRDIPRCLNSGQRKEIYLQDEGPQWCRDLRKAPYDAN